MRRFLCFLLLTTPLLASPPSPIAKLGEQRLPLPQGSAPRIDRPFFDGNRLLWESSATGPAVCSTGATETQRVIRLLAPRVDDVRCSAGGGVLVGVAADGKAAWRRPLGFRSGEHTLDEVVLGATADGIVLSNLTVVSPKTGETLVPPPVHPVDQGRRTVPDYDLSHGAIYLPHRRAFVIFDADVTLLKREGGLYLLAPAQGKKELLLGVSTTLLGGYWRVEEMVLSPDRRHLLLAQKLAVRGPGGVSFTVVDLASRRAVFEERFSEGHFCRDPRLVVGPGGHVGFAYLDETEGRRVLVRYRLRQ